ncbi:acyl-CoA thioesterase [Neorhizobium sp. P12A]|uniref:acyl-CoA thioesterase n=1 Tax=Neorhizobium sp. P12A TaxID=2268027 RepID=UPI0011EDAD76|nr:thioesterase family protein [Neorhizobium sp. P12A]KAA0693771.1 acyl-CoA thioesterase [Neorhizobium sp. P12A]
MFQRQELVRFQHCDPAGIVFYPRYVEMINATIEDWFAQAVGTDFAKIHGELKSAIPVVSLKIDFHAPSRLGERLDFNLAIEKLGSTSIKIHVSASAGGGVRLSALVTLVHISLEDYRPRPWPDAIRKSFAS